MKEGTCKTCGLEGNVCNVCENCEHHCTCGKKNKHPKK